MRRAPAASGLAPTTKRSAAPAFGRVEGLGGGLAGFAAVLATVAVALAAGSGPARAFPDGAPWETADDAEGCMSSSCQSLPTDLSS